MELKKWLGISAGVIAMALPVTSFSQSWPDAGGARVQKVSWQDRDDHRRRDDDDDRDRGRGQYGQYGQYGNYGRNGYHGVLAPEWQSKFDSYYQRWLSYRASNNQGEVSSMEGRMNDIMRNYNIPAGTPYGAVASPGIGGNNGYYGRGGYGRGDNDADDRGGYRGGYGNGGYGNGGYGNGGYYGGNGRYGYHGVLAPEWQSKFDSYYQRWLSYRSTNNRGEMSSMEGRMQDIMRNYNIPLNVPYGEVASAGVGGGYRR